MMAFQHYLYVSTNFFCPIVSVTLQFDRLAIISMNYLCWKLYFYVLNSRQSQGKIYG